MANERPRTRMRTTVVAGTAAVVVVTATAGVSAHEGGAGGGTLHACVANATGALRALADGAQQCRANETPVHWTVGDGGSAALEAFRAELARADNPEDLVHWNNLAGVPAGLADGVAYDDLGPLPHGSVGSATVQDRSLTGDDLAEGSVGSAAIVNGTVRAEDLGLGSVTGDAVLDGSIRATDLAGSYADGTVGAVTGEKIADGSVEPRDLRPEVATAARPGPVALSSTASEVGTAEVQAAAGNLVTLSGQVQLDLSGTCSPCSAVVSYQLVRNGAPLGPLYRIELSERHTQDVAGVAFHDTVRAAGAQGYALRLSAAGSPVSAGNLVLTAQVLGPE